MNNLRLSKYLTRFSLILLLICNTFWLVFSLFSGAERYGGGLEGMIKNSPNALPWILISFYIYFAWKGKLLGGATIFTLGILSIFAFPKIISFWIVSFPLIFLGSLLMIGYFLKKKTSEN